MIFHKSDPTPAPGTEQDFVRKSAQVDPSQEFYLPYRLKSLARILPCILAYSLVWASQGSDQRKPVIFPSISSYALDKSKVNIPSGLAGQVNLLLIFFQPEQQKQIDTWMPLAQALQHTNFNFRWYRMPVSEHENAIFRWWENSSMRSEETDRETWPWIVPLYVNKLGFRNALQIPNERNIVALLVDKQGHVLWRASGVLTPEERAGLTAAVQSH
jgi:predicted transcriptional regulator